MMTFEQAREYIKELEKKGSVFGLDGICRLMARLGDVQERLKIVHIAGTNGKGSVGTFLASVLKEAGYRVGRYLSPAVFSPLEVWQIDGEWIAKEEYAFVCSKVNEACDRLLAEENIVPTAFEVETAMAFVWFEREKCDYVLLETGMGGRMDATNLIRKPLCSVITSISMDHMQFLGNTLAEIAAEKAEIIKCRCPVITIRQNPQVMSVIEQKAKACESKLIVAEPDFAEITAQDITEIRYRCTSVQERGETESLTGEISLSTGAGYQIENSMLAIAVLQEVWKLPFEIIQNGIKKARWAGRFETVLTAPLFIIDGAHNTGAAEKLRETVQKHFTNRKITYIIGVLADKEYRNMLRILLPYAARVFTVTPGHKRALSAEQLKREAESVLFEQNEKKRNGRVVCGAGAAGKERSQMPESVCEAENIEVIACETPREAAMKAIAAAKSSNSGHKEVILAFGSLSYLCEIRQYCRTLGTLSAERQVNLPLCETGCAQPQKETCRFAAAAGAMLTEDERCCEHKMEDGLP